MNSIKDPLNTIEVNANGFGLAGVPVEFRYLHDEKGAIVACIVCALEGYRASSYGVDIVVGTARTHYLDKGKSSKVKGRMIAAARLDHFLRHSLDSRFVFTFILGTDGKWKGTGYYNEKEKAFWEKYLPSEYLSKIFYRLSKRQ